MLDDILEGLVADATLVTDVGSRLGRLNGNKLLFALDDGRRHLRDHDSPPEVVVALQDALSEGLKAIFPITLHDLKNGWRPYVRSRAREVRTSIFLVFSVLTIVLVAYITQLYDRTRAIYATTLELQEGRGAEQSIRLFGMLKRNQQDVIEALSTGKKDFLYDSFSKALFDLELMNMRYQAYSPIANGVLEELDFATRIEKLFGLDDTRGNALVNEYEKNYLLPPDKYEAIKKATLDATMKEADTQYKGDLKEADIHSLMRLYISDAKAFNSLIQVNFDLLQPADYSKFIFDLRNRLSSVGSWILPVLYGLLGAIVFHMRRLLDPLLPDPSVVRFIFRLVLGGFAGVILVWFWTPAPSGKGAPVEFATLTSFGAAFLIGFSTDVFFQALDRFVAYVSQTVGQAPA